MHGSKLTALLLLTFMWSSLFAQTTGTIKIRKDRDTIHPIVYFADQDSGPLKLRGFLIDKCLEPTYGVINRFEVIIEDNNGEWQLLKNESGCFSGENYNSLEMLGNGTHIEFINIIGNNEKGKEIIYPGMKFVIRK
ncbi:MAG TPA: hypothetical protein DCF89_09185 [Flavobacteriales bacterium]|nr:hypothetical protein [Crocinitomicaceae bacterium]HAE31277.1 hypothetical protein [Flavobacteriales bacterium]|tara:strand:+ start:3496 stop:3903 length:408 start_codon:yes stop_codon:yes gene_type:complete